MPGPDLPAPPYLGQIFFTTHKGNGFSETYYMKGTSYAQAKTNLITVAEARAGLFTSDHYIPYVRVSRMDMKREVSIQGFGRTALQGTYGAEVHKDTCPDSDGLLVRFQTADYHYALKCLRLLPEDCQDNQEFLPTAAYTAALTLYFAAVETNCQLVLKWSGAYAAYDISSSFYERISRRKVGLPFGHSVGRTRRR